MYKNVSSLLRNLEREGCRPIVVASHPRSGTHLCIDTLRLNFDACASPKRRLENSERLYLNLDDAALAGGPKTRTIEAILRRSRRPLIKTHCDADLTAISIWGGPVRIDPDVSAWLRENATIVYVYRDGRDVICSLEHFVRTYPPKLDIPLRALMRQEVCGMSRARAWARHVETWTATPGVCCVRMEELVRDTDRVVGDLARWCDLPWAGGPARLPPRCGTGPLARLRARFSVSPPSTEIVPRVANSRGHRWTDLFSDADREFFHREAGDVLAALGYLPTFASESV